MAVYDLHFEQQKKTNKQKEHGKRDGSHNPF
jgi:hypothetical protein